VVDTEVLGTGEAGRPDCRNAIETELDCTADRMVHDAPAQEIIGPDSIGYQDQTPEIHPG
jgi:hypothetical protein